MFTRNRISIFILSLLLIGSFFINRTDSDETKELADGTEILLNESFTSGSNWQLDEGLQVTSSEGKNSSAAIKMQATYKHNKPYIYEAKAKQCISLKDNLAEYFVLEADVNLLDIPKHKSSHRINLTWYDNDQCTHAGQFGWFIEPKAETGWQHVVNTNLQRALGSQSVLISIVQNRSSSIVKNTDPSSPKMAVAIWDNIKLSAKPTVSYGNPAVHVPENKQNYILNSDFSENSNWRENKYRVTTSYVDFEGKNDSRAFRTSLKHAKEGGIGLGASSQCVNIPKNKRYQLGISYRVDQNSSQKGGGRLRPTWYKFQDCKGASRSSGQHADINESFNWVDLKIDNLLAPSDVQSVKIELIQSIKGIGEYTIIWDDAYLRPLD